MQSESSTSLPHIELPVKFYFLSERAIRRRSLDKTKQDDGDYDPGTRHHADKREKSMLCYAVSTKTGKRYVGYSGTSGNLSSQFFQEEAKPKFNIEEVNDQVIRRRGRVEEIGKIKSTEKVPKADRYIPVDNCAEVSALSIAVSFKDRKEELKDLIFISFNSKGECKAPCNNCMQWITKSYGYFKDKDSFVPGSI
jgi:hypothetical protein